MGPPLGRQCRRTQCPLRASGFLIEFMQAFILSPSSNLISEAGNTGGSASTGRASLSSFMNYASSFQDSHALFYVASTATITEYHHARDFVFIWLTCSTNS
ncbi:hypothetical protein AMTR_s00069p00179430 [Amborella trichopoda]|uniref:Uncharacterized protein n=1 Tax=Amborella trichopoda TaxID=13333 RepID=U5DG88_AMBTC|nr:hypothetical protein AMTR_s00069p00179430 [Amborella trichopoda]